MLELRNVVGELKNLHQSALVLLRGDLWGPPLVKLGVDHPQPHATLSIGQTNKHGTTGLVYNGDASQTVVRGQTSEALLITPPSPSKIGNLKITESIPSNMSGGGTIYYLNFDHRHIVFLPCKYHSNYDNYDFHQFSLLAVFQI